MLTSGGQLQVTRNPLSNTYPFKQRLIFRCTTAVDEKLKLLAYLSRATMENFQLIAFLKALLFMQVSIHLHAIAKGV